MNFKKNIKYNRLRINLILMLFALSFNLHSQEFSVDDIFKMAKNQRLFESKMAQTDFTLVKIEDSRYVNYQKVGDKKNVFDIPLKTDWSKTLDYPIPTNDVSKKGDENYYYIEDKITGIVLIKRRYITYAENYNLNEETGSTWFTHKTEYELEEIPSTNNLYNSPPHNSITMQFTNCTQYSLCKKISKEINNKWNYDQVMKYTDNGYLYVYRLNNNQANIKKYNDGAVTIDIMLND